MTTPKPSPAPSGSYRIRIRGHLEPAWSAWFDSLVVARTEDGTTDLVGPLVDQAALFGVLTRLRDLGATLLLVEHLMPRPEDPGREGRPGPRTTASGQPLTG